MPQGWTCRTRPPAVGSCLTPRRQPIFSRFWQQRGWKCPAIWPSRPLGPMDGAAMLNVLLVALEAASAPLAAMASRSPCRRAWMRGRGRPSHRCSGSLLIGIWRLARVRGAAGEQWRLFLGVGVLGGFTTFSAYSLETMRMIERNDWPGASTYSIGSVLAASPLSPSA